MSLVVFSYSFAIAVLVLMQLYMNMQFLQDMYSCKDRTIYLDAQSKDSFVK